MQHKNFFKVALKLWPSKKIKGYDISKKVTADKIEFGKREASIFQTLSHISKLALYRLCHILQSVGS